MDTKKCFQQRSLSRVQRRAQPKARFTTKSRAHFSQILYAWLRRDLGKLISLGGTLGQSPHSEQTVSFTSELANKVPTSMVRVSLLARMQDRTNESGALTSDTTLNILSVDLKETAENTSHHFVCQRPGRCRSQIGPWAKSLKSKMTSLSSPIFFFLKKKEVIDHPSNLFIRK